MTKRLVVLQSNYIPWKGYFDLLHKADLFVVYDSVQFTKNDWRNRNLIKAGDDLGWLTIPVRSSGKSTQPIEEVEVVDGRWARKHWSRIEQCYGKAPHFRAYADLWAKRFEEAGTLSRLHDVNMVFLHGLAGDLGIATEIVSDHKFFPLEGDATERLVQMCISAGATSYLTGPAGLDYLETERFVEAGLTLEVIDYGGYVEYEQLGDGFEHGVSVLDLLANVGPEAASHLTGAVSTAVAK